MISKEKITIDWINTISKKNQKADKILVEKVIRAFLLLEGLAKYKVPFVFKGGTALMLHLDSTKRLSIDIDIILPEEIDKFEDILGKIAKEQGFLRTELQHRDTIPKNIGTKIKKEHFKFFYTPIHKSNKVEEYVLLDILFEKIAYTKLVKIPVQSSFVPNDGESFIVDIPCLEDMLGDKLTAFAPNTTGIPYFKKEDSMSMEIIKQLYDIGNLVDVVDDLSIVKATFFKFAVTELAYRNIERITEANVLEDIFQTSFCIVTRGADGKGDFGQLQQGIQRISGYIFSESYHIEKAITHASKAAYIAMLIKHDADNIEKFESPAQIKDWIIQEPLNNKLNKLKKSNPEAFFYWYKIYELTIQEN
ncbi:MAG: nucleotidyl transferase AbiEii/AbiGii toxin family protein [Bacteroidales bacterium]|nr:nucleotidyl transferase AbiEii/AbiGii toxin family protein [Bacteroidales bacterium]